jgi:mono/diheme cytochrome c family protein
MKTFVKVVLVIVAVMVLVAGAGVGYLFAKYPDVPPPEDLTVTATPEKIARGEYLAKSVSQCVDCHAVRDFTKYAGPVVEGTLGRGGENFGIPGTSVRALYSKNITPAGIGHWTDGELIRAITAGVNKDGRAAFSNHALSPLREDVARGYRGDRGVCADTRAARIHGAAAGSRHAASASRADLA